MAGAEHNVNHKRVFITKKRRQSKKQFKTIHSRTPRDMVLKANADIPNMLDSVIEATQKKHQTLLLKDTAHEDTITKLKWTTGVRPARMGKHGIAIKASKINKKKVKRNLKRTVSQKSILVGLNQNASMNLD